MTNAELAILSLIHEQPRHGYEIEQVIEERGMRDWTEVGFSSIYYLLKKLEKNGWVESQLEPEGGQGPARKVYHITPAGRAAWREGTLELLSNPRPVYDPFQLGLSNLPGLAPDEALAALCQYRDRVAERRTYVEQRWHRENVPLPDHVDAMFDLSMTLIEAELAWIERFIQRLTDKGAD
jgi:DNA-binding PadR family transcriptional regulator